MDIEEIFEDSGGRKCTDTKNAQEMAKLYCK